MGGPQRTHCKDCGVLLDYNNAILRGTSFRDRCRDCKNKYNSRRWNESYQASGEFRNKHIQRNRKRNLEKLYGITVEQYDKINMAQGGVCAICKFPCASGDRLAVDHCHRTNEVRGLLCKSCNIAIAAVNESEDVIYSMLEYLRQYNDRAEVQIRPSLKPDKET